MQSECHVARVNKLEKEGLKQLMTTVGKVIKEEENKNWCNRALFWLYV